MVAYRESKPLPRSFGPSLQVGAIPADLDRLTVITLQDVPNREYTLKLFTENEEIEIQKTANRSWTPAKRQYALISSLRTQAEVMHVQGRFVNL